MRRAACSARVCRPTFVAAEHDRTLLEMFDRGISFCGSTGSSSYLTARYFESRVKLDAEVAVASAKAFATHISDTDHWDIPKSHCWDILAAILKSKAIIRYNKYVRAKYFANIAITSLTR